MSQAWNFLKADQNNIVSQRPQGDKEGMGSWQTMHPAVQRHGKKVSLPGMENNNYDKYGVRPDIGSNTQGEWGSAQTNQTDGLAESVGSPDSPQRAMDYLGQGEATQAFPERTREAKRNLANFQQQQQQKPIEQGLPQMAPNVMQQMQPSQQ